MGSYTHLDLDERRKLYQLTSAGRSARQAAAELGRHPSTIYRELKRSIDDIAAASYAPLPRAHPK